jgi:hypothetical protein
MKVYIAGGRAQTRTGPGVCCWINAAGRLGDVICFLRDDDVIVGRV